MLQFTTVFYIHKATDTVQARLERALKKAPDLAFLYTLPINIFVNSI